MTHRDRQTDLTRHAILEALIDVIGKQGVHAFSVQNVADAAAVSHRTVYRHYPSREALLDGLNDWLSDAFEGDLAEAMATGTRDVAPRDIGRMTETAYGMFAAHEALIDTLVTLSWGARLALSSRARRTVWFERWLAPATKRLDPDDARAAAAIVRALGSSTTWLHLRRHSKASDGALARTARWAVETLIADLEAGGGPQPHPDAP